MPAIAQCQIAAFDAVTLIVVAFVAGEVAEVFELPLALALDLPQREWAILGFFLDHPEKVLSKERIVAAVCSWDQDMSVNAVEVYVSRLRTKLEPAGIRIRTIRGLGYMLEDLPHDAKPA